MRQDLLAQLLELPRVEDPEVRRAGFRQAFAALGVGDARLGPMALGGVDPDALARAIRVASSAGLLNDLGFLAPSAAAVALYEIVNALPLGPERRIVGRMVLSHLYQGNAETFATLASRMALGAVRGLQGAGVRARVELCLGVRGNAGVDRMALAFLTRRELAREYVSTPAQGSLTDRRLAGQLIERAAREAARRASAGDEHALRIFRGVFQPWRQTLLPRAETFDITAAAWHTLLADREGLVWRHVAVARGLLSGVLPHFAQETKALLKPELSPTEWRRGATSLAARIAVDRESGLTDALDLLDSPLLRRDPGIAMALVWGLGEVAEVEPEAADELLEAIANQSPISVADSLVALRQDVPGVGAKATTICSAALRQSLAMPEVDDGLSSLARDILGDLEDGGLGRELFAALHAGLDAFAEHGSARAFEIAQTALDIADARVSELESLDVTYEATPSAVEPRRLAMSLLREIDGGMLETRTLTSLLLLDRPPGTDSGGVTSVDDLDARLARWLLDPSRRTVDSEQVHAQATLHQRQLRALLHLIDSGHTDFGDDQERRVRVRSRWALACRLFVAQVRAQPGSRLARAVIATVARGFDALARDGAAEAIDVFLCAAMSFPEPGHVSIVAEASMQPDVSQLLSHYARFCAQPAEQAGARLAAFRQFLEAFPLQTTLRAEACRITAWTLVRALDAVLAAGSLRALVPDDGGHGPLAAIEDAIVQLSELVVGAERRCFEETKRRDVWRGRRHALEAAVEKAANTHADHELADALTTTARAAEAVLPTGIAALITQVLPRISTLQTDRPSLPQAYVGHRDLALPAWVPSRRILGGFYVITQIGGGNVGSVFVVKRAEERHDPTAERFALKVPDYNATAARSMGEAEFLRLFREEAGALLAIPDHPNIARFVTFDAGAKPKPILVMELVEGVSCERAISSARLTTNRGLTVLDGVLCGLESMHDTGVAHLDVKPSNAILRESGEPVLVDFGLAGRKLRPGCATLCYGAPEVWEAEPGTAIPPPPADIYAFGCFAYEILTSQTLFEGTSDVAIISAHLTHDGLPPPLDAMARDRALAPLARFLYHCLRQDPAQRATARALRRELHTLMPLKDLPWPLVLKDEAVPSPRPPSARRR